MALARKISRRKATWIQLGVVLDDVRNCLEDEGVPLVGKCIGLKKELEKTIETIHVLDEEILNVLEPADIEKDVLESAKVLRPTHELIAELDLKIESLRVSNKPPSESGSVNVSVNSSVSGSQCKLPKLELPIFKGSVLEWQGFYEHFVVTVHEQESLSDVNKFIYLKRYLAGNALAVVSGLSLTSTNYLEAIKLLKQRFGNPQVLISAYMESLLQLKKIHNMSDIEGLRKLANDVENCVRNLRTMKVETSTYGSLLIPILKDRLPDDVIVHISRRFGCEIWSLDLLLKYLNEEIQTSENCVSIINKNLPGSNKRERKDDHFTAYNFYAQGEEKDSKKCVFCWKDGHSPFQCRKVTNARSRTDILRSRKRCYLCLGLGHQQRNCFSNYVCRNCNGKHHISICFGKRSDVKNNDSVKNDVENRVGYVNKVVTSWLLRRKVFCYKPLRLRFVVLRKSVAREFCLTVAARGVILRKNCVEGSS